jgi:hypothetical protein
MKSGSIQKSTLITTPAIAAEIPVPPTHGERSY